MDCIFCKIVKDLLPSTKIYEDEDILAFANISPMAKIHQLVIPKIHIESCDKITSDNSGLIARIFEKIPEIAEKSGITNGYRVVSNCGSDGEQSVKHLHFHIIGGEKLGVNFGRGKINE